jgi:hypothetical protein
VFLCLLNSRLNRQATVMEGSFLGGPSTGAREVAGRPPYTGLSGCHYACPTWTRTTQPPMHPGQGTSLPGTGWAPPHLAHAQGRGAAPTCCQLAERKTVNFDVRSSAAATANSLLVSVTPTGPCSTLKPTPGPAKSPKGSVPRILSSELYLGCPTELQPQFRRGFAPEPGTRLELVTSSLPKDALYRLS